MQPRVYIQKDADRRLVPSVEPFLRNSLLSGKCLMDPAQMDTESAAACKWLGWGIGKGVTHLRDNVSVFGIPDTFISGLHGELVQGFNDVDPVPTCYEDDHEKGFGGFIRWVYFVHPTDSNQNVFGIDFSPLMPNTGGVAVCLNAALRTAEVASRHGIPLDCQIALLDWDMTEPRFLTQWRETNELSTLGSWITKGQGLFAPHGSICPSCLESTFESTHNFCYLCGKDPNNIQGGK